MSSSRRSSWPSRPTTRSRPLSTTMPPADPWRSSKAAPILVYLAEKTGKLLAASGPGAQGARVDLLAGGRPWVPCSASSATSSSGPREVANDAIDRFTTESAAPLRGHEKKARPPSPTSPGPTIRSPTSPPMAWTFAASTMLSRAAPGPGANTPPLDPDGLKAGGRARGGEAAEWRSRSLTRSGPPARNLCSRVGFTFSPAGVWGRSCGVIEMARRPPRRLGGLTA